MSHPVAPDMAVVIVTPRAPLEIIIVAPSRNQLALEDSDISDFARYDIVEAGHIESIGSVKRVKTRKAEEDVDWYSEKSQGVYEIRDFVEFKTTWHPIGV